MNILNTYKIYEYYQNLIQKERVYPTKEDAINHSKCRKTTCNIKATCRDLKYIYGADLLHNLNRVHFRDLLFPPAAIGLPIILCNGVTSVIEVLVAGESTGYILTKDNLTL